MEKYYRLNETVKGHSIIKESVLKDPAALADILKRGPEKDWYTSLYFYSDDAKVHFDSHNNSIAGYDGPAYTDKLFFDLDNKDLNKARLDTLELVHRLQKDGVDIDDNCRIYFSGNKGFHVEVALNTTLTPEVLEMVAKNIAGDLESFDDVIYNKTRLIRLVNTKHQATGLYKIELNSIDLTLTPDQIKDIAKNKSELFQATPMKNTTFINKYNKVEVTKKKIVTAANASVDNGIRGLAEIDFTRLPKNKPRCIYALEQGVMQAGIGERNAVFLRLAAYYRGQGYTKDVAYNMLKGIARENARLYPEQDAFHKDEIWNTVINSAYSDNGKFKSIPGATGTDPENELVKKYCEAVKPYTNKSCCLHGHLTEDKTTVKIDEVFDSFNSFATNFDQNLVKTGINFIDDNMKIAVGTTNLLVGCAGSGKTTLSLNMMENANKLNQQTVFFSLDMNKNLVYLKLAQKLTRYKQDEIMNFHKAKDTKKVEEIRNIIREHYGKTYFDFSSILSLEQMRDKIFDIEQKQGEKIKLVVVDYASRIASPYADNYASANYNALKSKEIADVTDTAFVIVSQISRNMGDGCTPLRTKRAAKDSGTWEEAANGVITLWRPFLGNPENDNVLRLYLAKNRMGQELEQVLYWNGAKGLIRDMDQFELDQYNIERGHKAEKDYLLSKQNKNT